VELSGEVCSKEVATGSKSERSAVVLKTRDSEYILRIVGGNAFHDDRLAALVGKRIRADGELHGTTFLMRAWLPE
jgi:hypothetical protein